MKITPLDIKKRQFKKIFRGYDPVDVAAYLDVVANELEEALKHQKEMKDQVVLLETQLKDFKSFEKVLQQTLMQAQETSGKAIENSRKEGQLIIQESEQKAAQIVDKARNDLTSLKEQIMILKAKKDSIVSRLKMLLHSELELIRALEVDEELMERESKEMKQDFSKEKMEIEEIIKSLEQKTI